MEPNAMVLVDAASVPAAVALVFPRVAIPDVQPHRKRPLRSIVGSAVFRNLFSTRAQKDGQRELLKPAKDTIYDYL
jgi:hypothetical protein